MVTLRFSFALIFFAILLNSFTLTLGCTDHDKIKSPASLSTSSIKSDSCKNGNNISPLAFEALRILFRQMDDDRDGQVDLSESNEFLCEELQYKNKKCQQKRQENLHINGSEHISVTELLSMWVSSEVHNWTIDQTADWMAKVVKLPEYQEKVFRMKINGTHLPQIAVNHKDFLTTHFGIKEVKTKKRLLLKAQDAVLFGPPNKCAGSHEKDMIIILLLIGAASISYWAYHRHSNMSRKIEQLMKVEEELKDLQHRQEQAKHEKDKSEIMNDSISIPANDKENIKLGLLQDKTKRSATKCNQQPPQNVALQQEMWHPPEELIKLLQATHDLEIKEHKRKLDEVDQLREKARTACEKLMKSRTKYLNAFIPTIHSRIVDEVELTLIKAKMNTIKINKEEQERIQRWNKIEAQLNFKFRKNKQ